MPDLPTVFERAQRCVLGFSGRRGPLLSPMAFWSDGASLWMSTPAASVKARALRARPDVSVYVPPPDATSDGAVATGRARVFGLHDPLGLAVHGPVVSAAMTALAATNAGTILGYVQDARFVPARFRPRNRVAVRVRLDEVAVVRPPDAVPGIAPALPALVSPAVRRALAGVRDVAVAREDPDGRVRVGPATWGAGFTLALPPGQSIADGTAAAVYLGTDPRHRPTLVMGLSLVGDLAGGALRAQRATWWEGFDLTTVDLPASRPSITLPD